MQVQDQEQVVCNKDHTQIMKGKRTKRLRLPSPLRLAMPSSTDDNSGGHETSSIEFSEGDMANCLILLARGRNQKAEPDKKEAGPYLYKCKTCNRCFPSFQALGGHRASHSKAKPNSATEEKQAVATNCVDKEDDPHDCGPTSTTLTLQIPNRTLLYSHSSTGTVTKSKVHECSLCGAEFSSGQALGGHMRRHRSLVGTSTTTTITASMSRGENNIIGGGSPESQDDAKRPRNVLKLDLNLPAPEDDHRESKFPLQSKEKVIVFSASSLVDCHY